MQKHRSVENFNYANVPADSKLAVKKKTKNICGTQTYNRMHMHILEAIRNKLYIFTLIKNHARVGVSCTAL